MSPYLAIAGGLAVGYVLGVQKQRMKTDREIQAAGAEGNAFALKLASLKPTMTTPAEGLASDVRMLLGLNDPLGNWNNAAATKGLAAWGGV